ncbi:RagB/SusD family nutrient uptake outer membrane protein (plasmid) [Pedobacter sp. BS3]|uniref:RagB/SusD family nutrient uptake outer membrane protein n=1 Tax=Pedobacter sp. BS3 TaxID=2567937 RepID=UPI0011ECA3D8|nr:RagB/SusD family nutrient uptake outer membrane protein [Pedobacter sp. BS3]TZF85604.1 RagB/SusD family nutrient uptake outer membrane protein [Pedobacter sp. BS3]
MMKRKYKIPVLLSMALLLGTGCEKRLEEHPYTSFTTDYFKSAEGIRSAIVSVYSGLRYDFGPVGALGLANMGTDEWTYGDQVATGQEPQFLELGTYKIAATNGAILTPWNRNYSNINLCNAILQFTPDISNLNESEKNAIIAEARFLRAQNYLLLVEQFGAVPVDLGSGDLVFTNQPYTGFNRLPVDAILVKDFQAMIDDLTFASQNLPVTRPSNAFRVSQAAALHLLSKVYLFRAYSSAKQADDFKNAYNTAMELINNKGKYGVELLADYGMIHKQGNDYNREILFSIERLPLNNASNEVADPSNTFDGKVNIAANMFQPNYQGAAVVSGVSLIDDRPLQYGRPLRRFAPTAYIWQQAFADKINDSRYDNTFRTLWRVATLRTGADLEAFKTKLAGVGFAIGDTAIYLAPSDARASALKSAGKKYKVLGPSEYYSNQNTANNLYPALKKYDDTVRANYQDVSGRPFVVSKFSEAYLLAAEAALQDGHPADAVPLINTLRERAAFRPGLSDTELAARKTAMRISVGDINLNFILDERTRELCGESVRWPDLAMRKVLVQRVKQYNPDGAPNIQDYHLLRPIPDSQIKSVTDPDRAKYQNPHY